MVTPTKKVSSNGFENEKLLAKFEGTIVGIIANLEPAMLKEMILANELPHILEALDRVPSFLNGIKKVLFDKRMEIIPQLTVENVIRYAQLYERADLAKMIATTKGSEWMRKFLIYLSVIFENLDKPAFEIKKIMAKRVQENKRKKQEEEEMDRELHEQQEEKLRQAIVGKKNIPMPPKQPIIEVKDELDTVDPTPDDSELDTALEPEAPDITADISDL